MNASGYQGIRFGELAEPLSARAKAEGVSVSTFVKRAVASALASHVSSASTSTPDQAIAGDLTDARVQTTLSPARAEQLRALAVAQGLSLSALVAKLIERAASTPNGLYPMEIQSVSDFRADMAALARLLGRKDDRLPADLEARIAVLRQRAEAYTNEAAAVMRLVRPPVEEK